MYRYTKLWTAVKLDKNGVVNCFGGQYFGCHWAKSKQACEIYKEDNLASGVPIPRELLFNCKGDFKMLYGDIKESESRRHWCSRFKYLINWYSKNQNRNKYNRRG